MPRDGPDMEEGKGLTLDALGDDILFQDFKQHFRRIHILVKAEYLVVSHFRYDTWLNKKRCSRTPLYIILVVSQITIDVMS